MSGNIEGGARHRGWWRIIVWGGPAVLLLIPAVAMQFSDEVQWTAFDFIVAAVILAVPAALIELTMRASRSVAYRAGVVVALGTAFLITWSNLAVGIIGNEDNPINQIFFGVILIAIVSAFIANFRARGMALAMAATAVAMAATAIPAFMDGSVVVRLIAIFTALWLLSAWLFHKAATGQATVAAES
ncbi:hypothetical protein [Brevundimonas lenta]|uniref:Uncharacterized protein n=1 Tax=Brevundimonas lenta TaxID=424796 RepID=A0A7W6JHJ3_9CAUL|nr:hypothetical protein [Brevundimonas lenta]MBB4084237.1 hypothetical protein [Brevundimonas lenta]